MKSYLLRIGLLVMLVIGIGLGNGSAAENENPSFQEINRLLTTTAIQMDIPPEVLKAVAWEESNWRQFDNGGSYISSDGGIGIMQITNKPAYDQTRLMNDIAYNIQAGAEILAEMYEREDLPKLKGADKSVIESWYFPVMAYNGTKPVNSPLYQSTGTVNSGAYQEKVFQDLSNHLLAGRTLAKYPFKVSDFGYDPSSAENIVFKKKSFITSDVITTSHAGFTKDSKVVTTSEVRLRKTPDTKKENDLGTLKGGTDLTVIGDFEYDDRPDIQNQFVWYPVKTSDGKTGYVSSAYLAKSIFTVNKVTDQSTKVTGNVAKGYSITVSGSDQVESKEVSAAHQNYSLTIFSKLKQGTKLSFTLKDTKGLVHEKRTITVTDGTPPVKPKVNAIDDNDTIITGTADKGSTIYAYVSDKVIGNATADSTGKYSIKITKQKAGTKIVLKAKDTAGNYSSSETKTVIDKTPPAKPKVNAIDDNDTVITGTAEKGSTVYAYISGKSIGHVKANSSTGKYSIKISKKKAGTKIVLKAKDTAGNYSSSETKAVIDKTPPAKPKVNTIDDNDTVITGTAEKGSRVYAYVSGKSIGHVKASSSTGKYSIKISKKKAGTKIVLKAKDAAGNYSSGITKNVIDKTPPAAPKVNKVTSKTTKVTGTAEKNATVKIYRGSTHLKTATVNSKGSYTLSIKAQKKGTALSVYAYDKAKNKSKVTKITVK